MRPIVGVICEYDPFHRGHKRQFERIREALPDARILCLMSGCFTQRGMPALHSPAARAKAALSSGADVVLELPCAFAVTDAERFALGGVGALNALGGVTHVSFGAEDALDTLWPAARLLEAQDALYRQTLKDGLNAGLSFAAAQGAALELRLPEAAEAIRKPNNILALCYLRALLRLGSDIVPLAVRRVGAYHAENLDLEGYPSATAVRAAFLRGDFAAADSACGYALPRAPVCLPDALDRVLLNEIRQKSTTELSTLPLCTEGLENRLKKCAEEAVSRQELLGMLKTKRYAYARLSRLCCHALLGATQETYQGRPSYLRLLGFRRESVSVLGQIAKGGLPLIARASRGDLADPLYRLDIRAYDLWALGAGLPAAYLARQKVIVI